jgi:hypothetical protein
MAREDDQSLADDQVGPLVCRLLAVHDIIVLTLRHSMFFTLNFFIFLAFAVLGKARINAFFNDTGNKLRKMGYLGVLIPGSAVGEHEQTSTSMQADLALARRHGHA